VGQATEAMSGPAPEKITAKSRLVRPEPLVSPFRHPIRWLRLACISLVAVLVLGHAGALVITGLYYAIFEWNAHMTAWWHSFISDANLRHCVRDVAEGFYGGAIAQQLLWNSFRRGRARYRDKPMNRIDRIEDILRIPNRKSKRPLRFWQIPYALLLWAPIYGVPGFVAVYLFDAIIRREVSVLHSTVSALGPHAPWWQRVQAIDTSNWDKKLMGLAASFFFGRRPLRRVFDEVQLWFAERHVASRAPTHWYHPPTYRARCNHVAAQPDREGLGAIGRHAGLRAALLLTALVLAVVFAGLGFYVMTFIAS
jgi:hypothetical protein